MPVNGNTDRELAQSIKQNDYAAFRVMYDRYWSLLLDYACKRMKNRQDAEDAVQNVFIDFYERRSGLQVPDSLQAYLGAAVQYKIYDKFRQWLREEEAFKILRLEDVDYTTAPQYTAEYKQTDERLRQAIGKLPPRCKEAFLLSRDEQMTHRRIAEKLGISVKTVEKHISKALQILRTEMDGYYALPYLVLLLELWKR